MTLLPKKRFECIICHEKFKSSEVAVCDYLKQKHCISCHNFARCIRGKH